MSNLRTPSFVPDNAIGFNPSKQILTVVYRKLVGSSYDETLHKLSALGDFDLPLRVVIGREEGSSDDKDRMRRIGLPTNQQERKALFSIKDTIQINPAVRLGFSCSREQCFISIIDSNYRLNHLSMPVYNREQTIHFKEDIAENNGSKYYYEYAPWNNLSSVSKASILQPKLREKIGEPPLAPRPRQNVEDVVLKLKKRVSPPSNQGEGGNTVSSSTSVPASTSSSSTSVPAPTSTSSTSVPAPTPTPDDNSAEQSVFNLTDQQKAERRRTFRNWKLQRGRRRSTRRRRALRKTRRV